MAEITVVFVTRTGFSKGIAEKIAEKVGGKAAEVGDPANRKGFFGFMKAGAQASKGSDAAFIDPRVDLSKAKAVVIVQPIWASSVVPPMRSWLKAHKAELEGKKIGMVLTANGSSGEPVRKKYVEEFGQLDGFATIYQRDNPSVQGEKIESVLSALN